MGNATQGNDAAQWDAMRERLQALPLVQHSLKEVARSAGVRWRHAGGRRVYADLLTHKWQDIPKVLGRGEKKQRLLLIITMKLFCDEFDTSVPRGHTSGKSDARTGSNEGNGGAWEQVRRNLAEAAVAEMSLCDCALLVGRRWAYMRGDDPLKTFLEYNWDGLQELSGFGRRKTAELLDIARRVASMEPAYLSEQNHALTEEQPGTDIAGCLANLGIQPESPTELIFLSGRARSLLQSEGVCTVGDVLDFLNGTTAEQLRRRRGVGRQTVSELYAFLSAVVSERADLVRDFLPLSASGSGLCFSAFVKLILKDIPPESQRALYAYFAEKDTLRGVGRRIGITGSRVGQIVSAFMHRVDCGLAHFPKEKYSLWDAWQKREDLELYFEDDLNRSEKIVLAGALEKAFADSAEGQAIIAYWTSIFDEWWGYVCEREELYYGGLRVARFVRDQGKPQLLQSFLGYLERKPGIEVDRTSGKAVSRRRPLH